MSVYFNDNSRGFIHNGKGDMNVSMTKIGKIKAKNVAGGNITKTIHQASVAKEEKKITGMDLMKGAVKKFFGL